MAQKMQQKGPRTRSITEIADAAIGYFNVISSNAVGRGRIGYIDSKKWNAIAKDGFSSYYDRNEVAISGGVESVRLDEKDRAYEILRPIVYHYRDRSGMISHAKADNAEAFSKDIANGSASVLCAIVVSLHFMKDDGALKGPMEANIVRELMRNLKGLGPESFNEDSIAENADSGFVRNSFECYSRYGAMLLLAHNSFDYIKTVKQLLETSDEGLVKAIFVEAIADRHAAAFVKSIMQGSDMGISDEGIADMISRHIGRHDYEVVSSALGNGDGVQAGKGRSSGLKTYSVERDLETGVKLVERKTDDDGSGFYIVRVKVGSEHVRESVRAVIMAGMRRKDETGSPNPEPLKVDVVHSNGQTFVEVAADYSRETKREMLKAVDSVAESIRARVAELETGGGGSA